MFVKGFLATSHPFFDAFFQADYLGKAIFVALFACSIVTWTLLASKVWMTRRIRRESLHFAELFSRHRRNPLTFEWQEAPKNPKNNPFYHLFFVLKKQTREILAKNHHFSKEQSMLTSADLEYVESHLWDTIALQSNGLERNLFILATIASLAPFLGLLGTVWGILSSFSEMQALSQTNQAVLQGLSLALATTVFGLIDAIPALVGYNYLKNANLSFQKEMEHFSHQTLSAVELQYREVERGGVA